MKKTTILVIALVALAGTQYLSSNRNLSSTFSEEANDASPAATGSSPGCDPNYSGCVPIASDVDCAGRGGNGPAYVQGPVRVIGSDIYQLDGDGDGIGCE
jgi:hypothetical protein